MTPTEAIAELRDLVRCRCHEAYKGRGLHDPDCNCDSADAVNVLEAALAASPEVQAMIREAEARVWEAAQSLARRLANDSEREAKMKDTTERQRIGLNLVRDTAATLEAAIRAEAAALREVKP